MTEIAPGAYVYPVWTNPKTAEVYYVEGLLSEDEADDYRPYKEVVELHRAMRSHETPDMPLGIKGQFDLAQFRVIPEGVFIARIANGEECHLPEGA